MGSKRFNTMTFAELEEYDCFIMADRQFGDGNYKVFRKLSEAEAAEKNVPCTRVGIDSKEKVIKVDDTPL